MAILKDLLPPPKSTFNGGFYDHSIDPWFKKRYSVSAESEKSDSIKPNRVPPYLKRAGFVPRKIGDFGDGGAFPEIHISQYPLDMGRARSSIPRSRVLPLTVDVHGDVAYDAIVKQNENSKKIVYSNHKDLIPKFLKNEGEVKVEDDEELQKEIEETRDETKCALEKIVNAKLGVAKRGSDSGSGSKFIKYKPSEQLGSGSFNSGAKERMVKMVERVSDPLDPPKFKHKRVPKGSGSGFVPVLHSPPRPLKVKDYKDWKIPPCISNWKNPKGYTIPLDKRLAADGRGLQDVQVSPNRAMFVEALYAAEHKCREALELRERVCEEMMVKEKERKEKELRVLAQRARAERTMVGNADMGSRERVQRDKIREERRRERRLEDKDGAMGKKRKVMRDRDRDRDITEKVALGMASAGEGRGEVMYDQRLFNQDKGMGSGFGSEDVYNVYDKGLFTVQPMLSTLCRPKKGGDEEMYGGAEEEVDKILKTDRFKADKGFAGTSEKGGSRVGIVEFEKVEEADPFGLDKFLSDVKKEKKVTGKVCNGGSMRFNGGSSMLGGSRRTRIDLGTGH